MKKTVLILTCLLCFSAAQCFAASDAIPAPPSGTNEQPAASAGLEDQGTRPEYIAEQKVKMLPSKHGGTVDAYMTNMAKIPFAEDLGWQVKALEDGYEVERSLLINNTKTFSYKWKVSDSGEVTPLNDGARSLMK